MIGDKKQLSKARIRQLYPLVFLLSGIVGMLSLFLGIPGLSWNPLAVFLFRRFGGFFIAGNTQGFLPPAS